MSEGAFMNDKQLRQRVVDELDFDPAIDATNIGVAAENGVVTLSGHVPNYAQKWAAERAAWRAKGVKAIAEELQVRLGSDGKHKDDEIAHRALNVLAWNVMVPDDSIHVKVQDGWVTLTGTVQWNFQREAAVAAIRRLSGISGVYNQVTLTPATRPADVKQRIADALKRHAEVEANQINIRVLDGGMVDIEGGVGNWDERQAVMRAAWSAPGVRAVTDHLRIG